MGNKFVDMQAVYSLKCLYLFTNEIAIVVHIEFQLVSFAFVIPSLNLVVF